MKAGKIIGGLTLLFIGIILLANTLNILDWSIWSNIFKLWPLILVSWGISLIFRGKSLSFMGPLIILLGIIFTVSTNFSGVTLEGELIKEVKTFSQEIATEIEKVPEIEISPEGQVISETEPAQPTEIPLETKEHSKIEKASVGLKFDMGEFILGKPTQLLYECTSHYRYKEFEPFEDYSAIGKEANIYISHSPVKGNFRNPQNKWELKLNNQIIYNLSVKTGALDTDCDLSAFQIEKFTLESGASNIKLVVPKYNSKIIIDAGVSNIDIVIPKDVGAIVDIDSGISVKDLDGFTKRDNEYISHNYNDSEFKVDIEIDCGISNIHIYYKNIP